MSYTAEILTISDKGARGEREDKSGPVLCELAAEHGYQVVYTAIIPDEKDQIQAELIKCSDELHVNLVLTTGGTGFSPRDVTPDVCRAHRRLQPAGRDRRDSAWHGNAHV